MLLVLDRQTLGDGLLGNRILDNRLLGSRILDNRMLRNCVFRNGARRNSAEVFPGDISLFRGLQSADQGLFLDGHGGLPAF